MEKGSILRGKEEPRRWRMEVKGVKEEVRHTERRGECVIILFLLDYTQWDLSSLLMYRIYIHHCFILNYC